MINPFKPMLAASLVSPRDSEEVLMTNLKALIYPVLATPKFDGIRCITMPGSKVGTNQISQPVCRSLKPVPNDHIRDLIATLPPGLDGEIMTYSERDLFDGIHRPRGFNEIQSDVMAVQGRPTFKFHVFDRGIGDTSTNYSERIMQLSGMQLPDFCVKVMPKKCRTIEELQDFMSLCIQEGYEGVCFRTMLHCPYKHGRSTLRQQWLVKWKLFETSEAIIVGFEEEMHNGNDARVGLLGQTERSSHQDMMIGKGRLGALVVEKRAEPNNSLWTFKIGTGFTADMRQDYWNRRDTLIGKTVTFKHQSYGAKTAPRIPVFVGIRSDIDMS